MGTDPETGFCVPECENLQWCPVLQLYECIDCARAFDEAQIEERHARMIAGMQRRR